jgi:hypothetical protein
VDTLASILREVSKMKDRSRAVVVGLTENVLDKMFETRLTSKE